MRISDWSSDVCSSDLLESFHRPYHAALAEALVEARGRFGHAILIDLHSMPPIPLGQPGHGARIVVGDRFGDSAGEWLIDRVMASAGRLGAVVTRNQPYSGGPIIDRKSVVGGKSV